MKIFSLTLVLHLGVVLFPFMTQEKIRFQAPQGVQSMPMTLKVVSQNKTVTKRKIRPKKIQKKSLQKTKTQTDPEMAEPQQNLLPQGEASKSFDQLIRNYVKPRYPRLAQKRAIQGDVKLKVFVNEQGKVQAVEILKSSGHSILDNEAVRAAKQWLFNANKSFSITKSVKYILKNF
jgi:protein TonB